MSAVLDAYAAVAGEEVIEHLHKLARPLEGRKVVHVNSTRRGGGVAEILDRLVPLKRELGLDASWEVIEGDEEFFQVTKGFHNGLQGNAVDLRPRLLESYLATNRRNAERLRGRLEEADFVFIHDPQPAALLGCCPKRGGKWIWRCHIDASRPHRPVWKFLRDFVRPYDASVFSLAAFAQTLAHPQYVVPPSIDPLSEKNIPLEDAEVEEVTERFGLDPVRPVLLQVSRFDRFKDPVGVIRAYRMVRRHAPVQLVLAGGEATDDPEGEAVLREVRDEAGEDPDVHILSMRPDAHRAINALQRRADVVLQKSTREGFGLTVTEALWKAKPVIGGETGGIKLQVINGHTGYLVNTPEGAAFRIRYLLNRPEESARMGEKGRRFVRENFLLTRHLRDYLALMLSLKHGAQDRIEVT
ncbi:MAG TPA: glycosyltransferase [Candidatus Polarisedimenticolia bacterium]|jgi:trehalose synthase